MEYSTWFLKTKDEFRSLFPLFTKKARVFLDVQLEKFVYTKTHLAKLYRWFFIALKKILFNWLLINCISRVWKEKEAEKYWIQGCSIFTQVVKKLLNFWARSAFYCNIFKPVLKWGAQFLSRGMRCYISWMTLRNIDAQILSTHLNILLNFYAGLVLGCLFFEQVLK